MVWHTECHLEIAFCQQIILQRRPKIATPLKKIKFIGGVIVYVSLAGTVHLFPDWQSVGSC